MQSSLRTCWTFWTLVGFFNVLVLYQIQWIFSHFIDKTELSKYFTNSYALLCGQADIYSSFEFNTFAYQCSNWTHDHCFFDAYC